VPSARGPLQLRAEHHKIDQHGDPLEVIAFGRQLPQPLLHIEEPRLTNHRPTPRRSASVNQAAVIVTGGFLKVSRKVFRDPSKCPFAKG
jgi:hypothetical protein